MVPLVRWRAIVLLWLLGPGLAAGSDAESLSWISQEVSDDDGQFAESLMDSLGGLPEELLSVDSGDLLYSLLTETSAPEESIDPATLSDASMPRQHYAYGEPALVAPGLNFRPPPRLPRGALKRSWLEGESWLLPLPSAGQVPEHFGTSQASGPIAAGLLYSHTVHFGMERATVNGGATDQFGFRLRPDHANISCALQQAAIPGGRPRPPNSSPLATAGFCTAEIAVSLVQDQIVAKITRSCPLLAVLVGPAAGSWSRRGVPRASFRPISFDFGGAPLAAAQETTFIRPDPREGILIVLSWRHWQVLWAHRGSLVYPDQSEEEFMAFARRVYLLGGEADGYALRFCLVRRITRVAAPR